LIQTPFVLLGVLHVTPALFVVHPGRRDDVGRLIQYDLGGECRHMFSAKARGDAAAEPLPLRPRNCEAIAVRDGEPMGDFSFGARSWMKEAAVSERKPSPGRSDRSSPSRHSAMPREHNADAAFSIKYSPSQQQRSTEKRSTPPSISAGVRSVITRAVKQTSPQKRESDQKARVDRLSRLSRHWEAR